MWSLYVSRVFRLRLMWLIACETQQDGLKMSEEQTTNNLEETRVEKEPNPLPKDWTNMKDHPKELVIGKIEDGVK